MHIHIRSMQARLALGMSILAGLAAYPLLATSDRAAASTPIRVLAVDVLEARSVPSYSVVHSYVGRVESARRSELAFEVPGMVNQVIPEEGDTIEAGAVLATLDTERLRARRAALEAARDAARANLELSQLTAGRHALLVRADVISPQVWDETRTQEDSRQAELRRLESEIATIDVDLNKSMLRAPFAGRVARRYVDEGNVVGAGIPVVRLLETARLEVRVGVAESDVRAIRPGSVQLVRVAGRDLEATVRSVLPERNRETRTVEVILRLAARGVGAAELRDGDLAEISVRRPVEATGAWLPTVALSEGARGLWSCYVAEPLPAGERIGDATHRLQRRQLEVLFEEAERVFVRGTLRDRERVVVRGIHRLVTGQNVRITGEEV